MIEGGNSESLRDRESVSMRRPWTAISATEAIPKVRRSPIEVHSPLLSTNGVEVSLVLCLRIELLLQLLYLT
jgi:hypothetical protein